MSAGGTVVRTTGVGALLAVATVLGADQVTKSVVVSLAGHLPVEVVPGVRIVAVRNPGVSFGQLAGTGDWVVAVVATVTVGLGLALLLAPIRLRLPLAVALGGACGNLLDRFRWDGSVLDFVAVGAWPAFNLADVAIVLGTAWLIVLVLRWHGGLSCRGEGPPGGRVGHA